MNARSTVVLLACLCTTGFLSCAKERAAQEPGSSGAPAQVPPEIPKVPIDAMPKILEAPIAYPEEARAHGEEGLIYVKALVGTDGRVREAAVDSKQPTSPVLEKAAVDAVKQWTFEPARSKGEPVAVWIVVPVNFKLK